MTKTMKKILSVCLVVLMCITAAPLDGFVGLDLGFGTKASAVYAAGECGTNVKYSLDNGVLTISGTGPMKNYSTNESPFSGSTSTKITSVIINDGVTSIGNNVFNGCSSLKSVTIPNSVTSIGNNAFDCCTSLESVTIPNKVMSIGNSAFYYCTSLKSVTIPDSVTSIGDSAFSTCRVLKSITIPSKVTEINSSTFFSCKALESVTIPNSVTTINNKAFRNCTSLKTVYYGGCSENMWNKITIGEDNEKLTAANRTYADHKCSYTANKNVITGTCNNCSGVVSATLTVDEAVPRTYTGYAIEPLKVECVNLNTELEITYKNNINVGTASGSITIGGATATQTFEIEEEKAHTFGDVQYKNADCVNDGYDYKQCSICKKYFPSNAATNDTNGKDNIDDFKMEALGHLFIGGYHYKDADCLNTGYDYKQCSICKKYFPSNADEKATNGKDNTDDFVIEAKGHTFGNTIEVKPASCLEDGVKSAYKQCSICEKYFPSNAATNDTNGKDDTADFVIDATGHTFGTVQHKDADCLSTGYDYKQCTACKKYFASDAAANATNGKDDTSSFVIPVTGHSDGEDGNDNLCDNCYAYIGDITLTVGTNITVPITYAYGSRDTLVKFVPDKTAQYIITSNISSDDQNTYPVITVYSLTDGSLHYEAYDSADVGKNFNLSTYTFTAGQVYCITFKNYIENAEAYTVNVALGCEHPSSKQTCMGYYCDTCGLYYGSRDSSKHELDTVQTCSGYKCKHCNRYFGEAAPDNHIWSTEGMCTACFTWHDHKTFDENGMCTVCKYALPYILTSSGTTTYYQKLTDALTAAKDGDTIKMQNDDGEHYLGVEITKAITLDLNGHTMSTPSSDSFAVKANVTFTDSVGGSYCEYGIMLYTSCTFSGGGFRYIAISSDFETEDNLDDYLASCCDYYNYSYIFGSDGGGTVGSLVDLSSKKDTFDLENAVMIKTNHSIVEVGAQDATCTESGHTAGEYCENCDYTTVTKTSDPTGHTFGNVQHKDADCTSGGYDYKQCSSCNKYFAPDAATNATNGKQDYSSFTTQKLNHSYTGDIKMDSNGKNGTHSYKCVNGCGQYGGAVAHEWDNGEITTPASHLKEGLKTYKCACGAEYTEPISKLEGHSYTPTVVPPTCTEQGYTEHKCACGDSYKDTYVDATGHNYENGTCTECGDKDPGYTDGSGDNTSDCDCMCHSSNKFVKFIYKIVRSFWKLLKWHKVCDCGAIHY